MAPTSAALNGSPIDDALNGTDGDDVILGGGGDDYVAGLGGADTIDGGDGDDLIGGNDGNDLLGGSSGNDGIDGGAGSDWLFGGEGADIVDGGANSDTLYGGPGADVFRLSAIDGNLDTVVDFDPLLDRWDLSGVIPAGVSDRIPSGYVSFQQTDAGYVIGVDQAGNGSYTPSLLLAGVNLSPTAPAVGDPIPDRIERDGIAVGIRDVTRSPHTAVYEWSGLNLMTTDPKGRTFVADTHGQVWEFEHGHLSSQPFLSLSAALGAAFLDDDKQMGLRSIAFHPDFDKPGTDGYHKIYTATTQTVAPAASDVAVFHSPGAPSAPFQDVLTEWTVQAGNDGVVDVTSKRELLRIDEILSSHNIEQLAFNPLADPGSADYGKLYIATGDGGHTTPISNLYGTAMSLQSLSGKILRIDPLEQGDQAYTIPTDNPYHGASDALPEIWARGLRHVQYITWDEPSGAMLFNDVGDHNIEEINVGVAGANYGWSQREGNFVLDSVDETRVYPLPEDDAGNGFTYPVAQYDHDEGDAITSGYVYRGQGIPELQGQYVFGDLVAGRIFYASLDDMLAHRDVTIHELTLVAGGVATNLIDLVHQRDPITERSDLRLGIGGDGELYVMTKQDGVIRKLVFDADPINGSEVNDTFYGTDFNNQITTGAGDDFVDGLGGHDRISGGNGSDLLRGGTGNDGIGAGAGNDALYGGGGNDVLDGGETGDDVLDGGGDADTLDAGAGRNFLTGGSGNDVFQFGAHAGSVNTVTDFLPGVDHLHVVDGLSVDAIIAGATATDGGASVLSLGEGQYIVVTGLQGPTAGWFL